MKKMMTCDDLRADLSNALQSVGLAKSENCYIAGNIGALGKLRLKKKDLLPAVTNAFQDVLGSDGTLFSPSASMNLCNTDIPFDRHSTPSNKMGALAEYIRQCDGSLRSPHPFWSISGLGKTADILNSVSRHSYGAGSPWSKFLDIDVRQINLGIHPSKAVTLIHHVEVTAGVPYRYTKEFHHPIVQKDGTVSTEPFYMSVMYRDAGIRKKIALNEHFFAEMEKRQLIETYVGSSGLQVWGFKMKDFYKLAIEFFIDDMYTYLESPPDARPYQS